MYRTVHIIALTRIATEENINDPLQLTLMLAK